MNRFEHKDEELVQPTLRKRKIDDASAAANALLSLVETPNAAVKRYRPSTPVAEAREFHISSLISPTAENREAYDTDERVGASPSSSAKIAQSFTPRSEMPRLPSTPEKGAKTIDSAELASAMALASLAYHSPDISKTATPVMSPQSQRYYSPHRRVSYQSKMPTMPTRLPNFHSHDPYAAYEYRRPENPYHPHNQVQDLNQHYNYRPRSDYQATSAPRNCNSWACDYCSNSFTSFDDATAHEKVCHHNPTNQSKISAMSSMQRNSYKPMTSTEDRISSPDDEDESKYFCGAVPLAVDGADPEWLSEMNCYVRSKCIEVFSATEEDVIKSSKRGRISLKQVGIRCKLCEDVDIQNRAMSAVSYPVSSTGIYESVKRWMKIHLRLCKCIPPEVRAKIEELEKKAFVPTTRQYWVDSAKALGIEDTISGLRFTKDVNDPSNIERAAKDLLKSRIGKTTPKNAKFPKAIESLPANSDYIVYASDESIITPFLYCLLRQVEPCQFTDADRYIARSRCAIGFNGFQCRHCSGHAGLGKYFPTTQKALSTNSTSQNIFSHVLKCRKCPKEVQEKLKALKYDKALFVRRTTGWRATFFEEVWKRLHGENA